MSEDAQTERLPGYYPVHPHWTAVPEWVTVGELMRLCDLGVISVGVISVSQYSPPPHSLEWRMRRAADGV